MKENLRLAAALVVDWLFTRIFGVAWAEPEDDSGFSPYHDLFI